jgi:exodeoxyribonuclease V alpha subunit
MNSDSLASAQEFLAGLVERVTFHNEENGFCVLRTKARGHRDLVTVVGQAASIAAGEWITASGEWVNDRTHGQQFRARFLKTSAPTSIEGIEKYLGSGMIRGIGPAYAKKLVRAFGEQVFDTIEAEPDRLREVDGIGPVRAKRIVDAWAEQKVVREIMMFLHSNGVGTARAVRIYKTYCGRALPMLITAWGVAYLYGPPITNESSLAISVSVSATRITSLRLTKLPGGSTWKRAPCSAENVARLVEDEPFAPLPAGQSVLRVLAHEGAHRPHGRLLIRDRRRSRRRWPPKAR